MRCVLSAGLPYASETVSAGLHKSVTSENDSERRTNLLHVKIRRLFMFALEIGIGIYSPDKAVHVFLDRRAESLQFRDLAPFLTLHTGVFRASVRKDTAQCIATIQWRVAPNVAGTCERADESVLHNRWTGVRNSEIEL